MKYNLIEQYELNNINLKIYEVKNQYNEIKPYVLVRVQINQITFDKFMNPEQAGKITLININKIEKKEGA